MKIVKALSRITAFMLLTTTGCFACDCLTLSEAQSFEKADVVLIGGVTRVEAQGAGAVFTLSVEKSLKGPGAEELRITSAMSDCDAQLYMGRRYIVYAQKFRGEYFASSCLSTKALEGPNSPPNDFTYITCPHTSEPRRNDLREIIAVTILSVIGSSLFGLLVRKLRGGAA